MILPVGLLAAALLILFQISRFSLFSIGSANEWIIILIGVSFIVVGILISRVLFGAQKPELSSTSATIPSTEKAKRLGISQRELEVLVEVAAGLSNQEIAGKLFISESTVKTHVSNLLVKLDAKRRTQAVLRAKEMGVI